jgi:hypothetical protein
MHGQFWKILSAVHSRQENLVQAIESTNSALPVQSLQTPGGTSSGTSCGATAAATDTGCLQISSRLKSKMWGAVEATIAATRTRDLIKDQLSSHMASWKVGTLLQLQFICNTLTSLQVVELVINSYPFIPRFGSGKSG